MMRAQVAQLVEHVTENHGVGGSIPPLGTIASVEHRPFHEANAALARFMREPRKEARTMPAKSKAQQMAAGAALSAKRGERSKSSLKGASKSMMSMSKSELEKMASTKRKGKPAHAHG